MSRRRPTILERPEQGWSSLLLFLGMLLVVGVSLVLMETLNDLGTVDYFGVQTLTTGVYDVWLNMGNLGGAAQIAATRRPPSS